MKVFDLVEFLAYILQAWNLLQQFAQSVLFLQNMQEYEGSLKKINKNKPFVRIF